MMTVIDRTKNKHEITGRLEAIVTLVIENAIEVALPLNAQVIFDCAGGKVSATIKHQLGDTRPET